MGLGVGWTRFNTVPSSQAAKMAAAFPVDFALQKTNRCLLHIQSMLRLRLCPLYCFWELSGFSDLRTFSSANGACKQQLQPHVSYHCDNVVAEGIITTDVLAVFMVASQKYALQRTRFAFKPGGEPR